MNAFINIIEDSPNVDFLCPKCGDIPQDDVVFLCNKCQQNELIFKEGIYICPACLKPGENFQCMLCDSKEVKAEFKDVAGNTFSK